MDLEQRRVLVLRVAAVYGYSVARASVVVDEICTAPGGSETVRYFLNRPPG